jgi:hypothetical protein
MIYAQPTRLSFGKPSVPISAMHTPVTAGHAGSGSPTFTRTCSQSSTAEHWGPSELGFTDRQEDQVPSGNSIPGARCPLCRQSRITAPQWNSAHASDQIAHDGMATPSHYQIVHMGPDSARMIWNDPGMVS